MDDTDQLQIQVQGLYHQWRTRRHRSLTANRHKNYHQRQTKRDSSPTANRHKNYHECQTRRDSSPTASGTRTIINAKQEETAHLQLQAQGLSSMPNKKRQLTYSFRHKDYHQCQTRRDSSPTASGTRTIINSRQEETAHRQLQAQGLSSTADKKRQLTYSFRHKDYHQQQTRTDSSHYHQQQTRRDSSPTTLGTRTIINSRQEETAHLQL